VVSVAYTTLKVKYYFVESPKLTLTYSQKNDRKVTYFRARGNFDKLTGKNDGGEK